MESPGIFGLGEPFGYGRLQQQWLQLPQPAAGGGFTWVTPAGYTSRVNVLCGLFTAAAVAANRTHKLTISDADNNVYAVMGISAIWTSGQSAAMNWFRGYSAQVGAASSGSVSAIMPALWLPPGFKLVVTGALYNAGDQWSGITMQVDQFPTGDLGYPTGKVLVDGQLDNSI